MVSKDGRVKLLDFGERGFRALADALGWANAVRFLRGYDPGSGNYTEERSALLPDLSLEDLTAEIERIQ
jgi:hypothetical protein